MDTIKLSEGKGEVSKQRYINAKLKVLREFGYTDLEEKTVSEQLEKVINGEELNVIGMFIEDDIDLS